MLGQKDFDATNSSWRSNSRSPSPPPPPPQLPPPPLESSFVIDVNVGYTSIPARFDKSASVRSNTNNKQRVKSFPFLRKKSRKEPSALHRINVNSSESNQAKSPTAAAAHSNYNNNSTSAKVSSELTKAGPKAVTQGKDDVLLQGSDYWGLDQSILEDMRPTKSNHPNNKQNEKASLFSPWQETNTSMAVEDLERRRNEGVQNLEEFRRIEEEVLNDELSGTRNLKRMLSQDVEQSAPVTHSDSWGAVTRPSNKQQSPQQQDGPPFHHTASRQQQQQHLIPQYDSDDYDNGPSVPRTASYDHHTPATGITTKKHYYNAEQNTSISSRANTPSRRAHSAGPPMNRSGAVVNSNDTDDNDDSHSKVSGRLIRPASTLKINNVTPTNARSGTPTNRRNNGTNHSASNKIPNSKATEHYNSQRETEDKIRALESEVETFKAENQNLKKLKRQQEQTLAEVLQKKDEMMRYCDEEKQRTIAWCEEQKQAIEKERRTVAKQLRDARQRALTSTTPIRREKAEMEALQATIEKIKMTHETAIKKWKARESSLHSLVSEQSEHMENMEKQLFSLEETRIGLLEFITVNGLRPPKALLSKGIAATGSNNNPKSKSTTPLSFPKKDTHRGYMEEVEFQLVPTHTTTYQASFDPLAGGSEEVKRIKSAPSTTTRMRREKSPAPQLVDDDDYPRVVESLDSMLDDFPSTKQLIDPSTRYHSSKIKPAVSAEPKQHVSKDVSITATEHGGKTLKRSTSRGSFRSKDQLSLSPKTMKSVSSSWARSSRSSGRYSNGSNSQNDHGDHDEDNYGNHHEDKDKHVVFTGVDAALHFFDDDLDSHTKKSDLAQTFKFTSLGSSGSGNKVQQQPMTSSVPRTTTNTAGIAAIDHQSDKSNNNGSNRTEEIRPDGSRFIRYRNGTTKDIDVKGNILIRFSNQDTKFTDVATGSIVYYYAENQTTHTTFVDGLELFEFPNGQKEMHFPSGKKEVTFPDRSKKTIYENGMQESVYPDGVVLREYADGRKEVLNN